MISIIVACDPKAVIGKQNKLPWRVPEDLKLFRERTLGHAVIMGRKTWDSIPRKPLDGRANIVISRNLWKPPVTQDGPYFFHSLKQAIATIQKSLLGPYVPYHDKDIFIIGGSHLYESALNEGLVDQIIMFKIHREYDGDVYFPKLGSEWTVAYTEPRQDFDLVVMNRLPLTTK